MGRLPMKPNTAAAWFGFAQKRLAAHDRVGAEGGLRMTVALSPTHAEAWCQLARLADDSGRSPEAARLFKRSLEQDLAAAANHMSLRDQLRLSLFLAMAD